MNNITLISPLFYQVRHLKDIDVGGAFMFVSESDVKGDKTISVEKLHNSFNTYKKGFVVSKTKDNITCIIMSEIVGFNVEVFEIDMICYPLKANELSISVEFTL